MASTPSALLCHRGRYLIVIVIILLASQQAGSAALNTALCT